jgi:hypothetical protein
LALYVTLYLGLSIAKMAQVPHEGGSPMADEDVREDIERLETRLEELADGAERCRKIAVFAKVVIAAGGLLLAAVLVGMVGFNPTAAISGTAAVIGGIVLLGGNASTLNQTLSEMRAAEARRADLIGRIELRAVDRPGSGGLLDAPAAMNSYATRVSIGE